MNSLRLPDTQIAWLQAHLNIEAAGDDLEKTYTFPHALNERRELSDTRQQEVRGGEGAWWMWRLRFYLASGECILEQEAPVARKVAERSRLVGSPAQQGLVARNEHIELATRYQRRGFATALYQAEEELYRRWAVREVHLRAVGAGVLVWMKAPFSFLPKNPAGLQARYRGWLGKRTGLSLTPRPAEYPSAFLADLNEVELYKVLA